MKPVPRKPVRKSAKSAASEHDGQFFEDILLSPKKTVRCGIGILDSIYDGILVADESAVVRYVNPEYTRITGVRPEQIVGKPLRAVRPGAILPDVIRTGKSVEGAFRREGDTEYVVDMAPIIIDGKIAGGVSVVKNITEVHRLSAELKKYISRADRLKTAVHHAYQAKYTFADIVGDSIAVRQVRRFAERISQADNDVLITGESGTGKEVFAQAIHNAGRWAAGPFVPVSCAVLSPTLVESELFGYGEGTFTGAKKGGKIGLFEIADGGTIFLDEIGELSVDMQAKLLRTLQERTIRRIGETEEYPIEVRVIASTNRDLRAMVKDGLFREDLYYRLNVMNIHLPSLRERSADVTLLADCFLKRLCEKTKRDLKFSPDVYERFLDYSWPGNIRELMHAVDFGASMTETTLISVYDLPKPLHPEVLPENIPGGSLRDILRGAERRVIESRFKQYGTGLSSKRRLARDLGISLATLYNRMKILGISS
jgi:PAS domain S-box-containing protein